MTPLFDTHCHLDFDDFAADRVAVLERAEAAGITRIMVPGTHAHSALKIESNTIRVQRSFGLHPYFIEAHQQSHIDWLEAQLDQHPTAPVGEIGLDATCSDYDLQCKLFEAHLALAARYQRCVILHHRKTQPDLLMRIKQVRDQLPDCGGVLHAFSGSYEQAKQWYELGFKLGVGGTITYSRAQKTRAAIGSIALDALVLETDAPDMPVAGQQGQRNEPAQVVTVLQSLLDLREEDEAIIRRQLWQSSCQLFGSAND
ncbi:TatD family hydrolase [Pseudidiomarina aestuarii]|uniref:TatD family hydrolase n=1 Tax=Pseudidiomarina aestuarii TaxID=624146 RepID=UPI003A970993